jgi:hypothetical protein
LKSTDETVLELISKVDDFVDLHEFMEDEDLDEALSLLVKFITKPEIPSSIAIPLVVKLQAIAAKMSVQASIYTTIKKGSSGSENYYKKNVYYSTAEALTKVVDALKYSARYPVV